MPPPHRIATSMGLETAHVIDVYAGFKSVLIKRRVPAVVSRFVRISATCDRNVHYVDVAAFEFVHQLLAEIRESTSETSHDSLNVLNSLLRCRILSASEILAIVRSLCNCPPSHVRRLLSELLDGGSIL